MAGQLIRRGERTWQVRVYMGRDSATGKRSYLYRTVHGTKSDAQRCLNELLTKKDRGVLQTMTTDTVNEYLDHWLDVAARPRLRESTFRDYRWMLERYVRPAIGNKRLAQLTPLDIQALYSKLQADGLSARTIRYIHSTLSSSLKQAVKWRILPQNPADFVDLPRQQRREMQALTPEQAREFLTEAAKDRNGLLFAFAMATGMRPGEYLALTWEDIDFDAGTAIVRRSLTNRKGVQAFTEPKTARSRRTIPLPRSMVQALAQYREAQLVECGGKPNGDTGLDLVFRSQNGSPIDKHNLVKRHFKPILKAARLPENIRLYDLRHTCATLLLAAGENPKVVAERLGHASTTMTLDVYSHVLPTMQQRAAERLEEMLFQAKPRQTIPARACK